MSRSFDVSTVCCCYFQCFCCLCVLARYGEIAVSKEEFLWMETDIASAIAYPVSTLLHPDCDFRSSFFSLCSFYFLSFFSPSVVSTHVKEWKLDIFTNGTRLLSTEEEPSDNWRFPHITDIIAFFWRVACKTFANCLFLFLISFTFFFSFANPITEVSKSAWIVLFSQLVQ